MLLTAPTARSCEVAQNDLEAKGWGVRGPLSLNNSVLWSDAARLEPLLQGAHGVRLVAAPAHRVWFLPSQFSVVIVVIGWSAAHHPRPTTITVINCPPPLTFIYHSGALCTLIGPDPQRSMP